MTLKDLIRKYREEKGLSQRQFAVACSLSNGYISMLEKGINPKTSQPVTPTLQVLKKIATAMGMTLSDLLNEADDMQVALLEDDIADEFKKIFVPTDDDEEYVDKLDLEIASLILSLSFEKKKEAINYLRYLASCDGSHSKLQFSTKATEEYCIPVAARNGKAGKVKVTSSAEERKAALDKELPGVSTPKKPDVF